MSLRMPLKCLKQKQKSFPIPLDTKGKPKLKIVAKDSVQPLPISTTLHLELHLNTPETAIFGARFGSAPVSHGERT